MSPYAERVFDDRSDNLQQLFSEMLDFFTNSILLCAVVAAATLVVIQFIKPLLRAVAQHQLLRHWKERVGQAETAIDRPWPSMLPKWLHGVLPAADRSWLSNDQRFPSPGSLWGTTSVGNGQFMRGFQSASELVLAQPSTSAAEYLALTAGAAEDQRYAILLIDAAGRDDPALVARLTQRAVLEPGPAGPAAVPGVSEALASARDAVAAAADRTLDALQLTLESRYSFIENLACVVIGVVIAASAALAVVGRLPPAVLALGLAAGLLALFVRDAAAGLVARRR